MKNRKTVKSWVESYLSKRKTPATSSEIVTGINGMSRSRAIPGSTIRRNVTKLMNEGRVLNVNPGAHPARYSLLG